jgi:hypothetical protein
MQRRQLTGYLIMTMLIIESHEGRTMTRSTEDRARAAAAQRRGWNADATRVKRADHLSREGCEVLAVLPTDRASHGAVYFAVLPDGSLAGDDVRGDAAAAAVLMACGRGAPAQWWAQIMAAFGTGVGGTLVTAEGNPSAVRKIRDLEVEFEPAVLTAGAGGGFELSFFAYDPDRAKPHRVQARLGADGSLDIQRRELPVRR